MELIGVLFSGFDPNVLHQAYKEEIKAGCLCFNNWWGGTKDTGGDHKFPEIVGYPTCIIVNEEYRSRVHNIRAMLNDYYKLLGVQIPILYSVTDFGGDPRITAQLITRIKEIKEHFVGYPFVLTIRTEHDQMKFYRSLYSYIYGIAKYRTVVDRHRSDVWELKQQIEVVNEEKQNMVNNLERQIVVVKEDKQNMQDDFERQIGMVKEEKQNMQDDFERQIGMVKEEKQNMQDDLENVRRELGSSIRKGNDCVRKLYNETTSRENTMRELVETTRRLKLITEENEKLIAILKANGLEMKAEEV